MKKILLLAYFIAANQFSYSQWKQEKFIIGTFADPRITYDNNFKKDSVSFALAKNAYINLLTGPQYYMGAKDFSMMDRTLKLAEKFGIKLLVIDSRLRIADPTFTEQTAKMIISHFDSLNNKAFAGYYFGGEFSKKNVYYVKKWTAFFKKNDPQKLAYSYLLPQYAFPTKVKYEDYLNNFLNDGNLPDVVAFDYYPFSKNGNILNTYFYNLDLIRKRAGNKPFWVYILSVPTPNYSDPTEYQLNFSAFCPIAYGAKGIIYFTYETIPERYNLKYGDAIIDRYGNPTKKYYIVQKINRYIDNILGPVIMNSTYIGSYHSGKNSTGEILPDNQTLHTSNLIKNINDNNLLAGLFKSHNSNMHYLILVNKKKETLSNIQITLHGDFSKSLKEYNRMSSYNGSITKKNITSRYENGNSRFSIDSFSPGEAVLLEF